MCGLAVFGEGQAALPFAALQSGAAWRLQAVADSTSAEDRIRPAARIVIFAKRPSTPQDAAGQRLRIDYAI